MGEIVLSVSRAMMTTEGVKAPVFGEVAELAIQRL